MWNVYPLIYGVVTTSQWCECVCVVCVCVRTCTRVQLQECRENGTRKACGATNRILQIIINYIKDCSILSLDVRPWTEIQEWILTG